MDQGNANVLMGASMIRALLADVDGFAWRETLRPIRAALFQKTPG